MTIISFKHRFIFIKPTKVAGTSFERAFCAVCDDKDVFTWRDDRKKRARREQFLPLHFHASAFTIRDILGHETFHAFLKISIIRNPYDWVVSSYAWNHINSRHVMSVPHFKVWLLYSRYKDVIETRVPRNREQCSLVDPYDVVDVMIRFEHFEEDLTALSHRLGLQENIYDIFKGIRDKGDIRPPALTARACFEGFPEGIEKIKNLFAIELEKFGYDLPWLSGGLSAHRACV